MRTLSNMQILALLLVPVGCSSLDEPLPERPNVRRGAFADTAEAAHVDPLTPEPAPSGCAVASRTSSSDEREMSALHEAACVEEALDAEGCPDTRVTRSFDPAGRVSKEILEVLDPAVNAYTYMQLSPHVRTFTRDAAGRAVLEEVDELLDGSVEERITRVFDEAGRLRQESHLRWGGTEHRSYDEEGREIEVVYDLGDGTHWTTVRTFSDDGRPLLDETTSDRPGEEGYLQRTAWSYDDAGRPLTKVYEHTPVYGGSTSSTVTWIYEGGRAVRTEQRSTFTGGYVAGDRFIVSELDENGNATLVQEDYPEDGVIDSITTRTFDAGSRMTSERVTDGTGERVFGNRTFAYDDDGRLVESNWLPTNGYYGSVSMTWTERRAYDEAGRVTRIEHSQDGVVSSVTSFQHDDMGRPLAELTDWDGDGSPDYRRLWDRDAHGNLRFTASEQADTGVVVDQRLGYDCLEADPS